MPSEARQLLVTVGPTLARAMEESDMRRYFDALPPEKAIGIVHVTISRSHVPNQVNVDCLLDTVPAPAAAVALRVAADHLRKAHGLEGEQPPIPSITDREAHVILAMCDTLVKRIRGRPPQPIDMTERGKFTMTHTEAVHALVGAFITARAVVQENSQ